MVLIVTWMLPTAGQGQGLWEKMYINPVKGSYPDGIHKVVASWDPQHGGLVSYITDTSAANFFKRSFYVRLNANGDTLWTQHSLFNKTFWNSTEEAKGICRLPNGDFVIAALCDIGGLEVFHVRRIDSTGLQQFQIVDYPPAGLAQQVDIHVINGPDGGYYIVKNKLVYYPYSGYSLIKGITWFERYNANNIVVARDSFIRGDYKSYNIPPCSYGSSSIEYYLPRTNAVQPSRDNGLFWVFNYDSSKIFLPSACGLVSTGAITGGNVRKYDSALHLQWQMPLTPALHLPRDSVFFSAYAVSTSDSGIIVAGTLVDTTTTPMSLVGRYNPYSTMLVRLDKAGTVTDMVRAPRNTYFGFITETSTGSILLEAFAIRLPRYKIIKGLCLLDKHFGLLRYTPQPFSTYPFQRLEALFANQYGGAFAPYFIDTSTTYKGWVEPIPAAVNFDSLLYHYPASVSGKELRDQNYNCTYEPGTDRPIANRLIRFANTAPSTFPYYTFSDALGNWKKPLPYGTYNITHALLPNKASECPAVAGFPGVSLSTPIPATGYNFYDTLRTNYRDMKVLLSALAFVPGFTRQLFVYASNNGGAMSSDTLRVTKPAALTYVSASPAPTSVSGNTLIWVLNNLAPDSTLAITINLTTPSATTIGTGLTFTAQIKEPLDAYQSDNSDTLARQVAGPVDPNRKTVNRLEYTTARKDWVYTIEFQNTGNYPAQDVVIADKLDTLLDLRTIRLLAASHGLPTVEWREGNELLFRFNNIYLQDSVHNEPASHGFVTYSISPVNNAKVDDVIYNAADIYFDFNAPVLTNTTANIISEDATVVHGITTARHFAAYPNPTTGALTIRSDAAGEGTLFDMQGRRLTQFRIEAGRSAVRLPADLAAGIYMLQGSTDSGEALGVLRIVVQ